MARLPTRANSYARSSRRFTPKEIPGLTIWRPNAGPHWQDAARTTPAGVGDPVGASDDASGNERHFTQSTTSKKPTLSSSGPSLAWDGADDVLSAVYSIDPYSRFAAMLALWIRNDADRFDVRPLGIAALDAENERGIEIAAGDNLQAAVGAQWDPENFEIICTTVADHDSTDGHFHSVVDAYVNGSNRVLIDKSAGDVVEGRITTSAGTVFFSTAGVSYSAGDTVFFAIRVSGGTAAEFYAGTASGGSLSTDTDTLGAGLTGTPTLHVGDDAFDTGEFDGAVNILVTCAGSADPITDRFNAGAGMPFSEWLGRHGRHLVARVGGNRDGSSWEVFTSDDATDLLEGAAQGAYQFTADTHKLDYGDEAYFDGFAKAGWLLEVDRTDGATGAIMSRWGAAAADQVFQIQLISAQSVRFTTSDGAGTGYQGNWGGTWCAAGKRFQLLIVVDLTQGTDAARLRCFYREYDATTKRFGAWAEDTATSFSGTAPATLPVPAGTPGLTFGARADGGVAARMVLSDARFIRSNAAVLNPLSDPARYYHPDEAPPDVWDQWIPFVGTTTAVLGGMSGAVTGASQVSDGRQHIGEFHQFLPRGAKLLKAAQVDLGLFDELNGVDRFAFFIALTPSQFDTSNQSIFSVWDNAGGDRVLGLMTDSSERIRIQFTNSDSVTMPASSMAAGSKYGVIAYYDGRQDPADRVRFALGAFNPETGDYAALTEVTAADGGGGAPAHLPVPAASVRGWIGRSASGLNNYEGLVDDLRLWIGEATPDFADLLQMRVYQERDGMASSGLPLPAHWYTADQTWNDRTYGGARFPLPRPSFARADTGRQLYADGVPRAAASGELRNKHAVFDEDGNLLGIGTLLERAYTNLNGSDDIATWPGSDSVTSGVSDPGGGSAAYTLSGDGTTGSQHRRAAVTFTGDGRKALAFVVRENSMPASGHQALTIWDATDLVERLLLRITGWVGGKPTITESVGSLLGLVPLGNGYWLVVGQATGVVAANSNGAYVYSNLAASPGSIDVWRVNVFDAAVPPAGILDANETTTHDALTVDLDDATPTAATYLWSGWVFEDANSTATRKALFKIGDDGGGAGLQLAVNGGALEVFYNNGTSNSAVTAGTVAYGDHVRAIIVQDDDGETYLTVSIEGAAEQTSTTITGISLPGAWQNPRVAIGTTAGATQHSNSVCERFTGTSGAHTIATMLTTWGDIVNYRTGDALADVDGVESGTIDWTDGRQPEGWSQNGTGGEIDRATGRATRGTWALRVKDARWDSITGAVAVDNWTAISLDGEKIVGAPTAVINNGMDSPVLVSGSMTKAGSAHRATAAANSRVAISTSAGAEGYFDAITAPIFTPGTFTVATKGVPTRVVWSSSKDGDTNSYLYAAIDESEKLEIGYRLDDGTRAEATSAGSVSIGAHSVSIECDGTTIRGYVDTTEVVSLALPAGLSGMDRVSLGGLVTVAADHPHDEKLGEAFLHAGRVYAAHERRMLHNHLAGNHDGLAVAA